MGVTSARVEKYWGKRNFGLDSLKSIMNRDMEEKGIVLRELSCRNAAELPPPGAAGLPPKLWRQSAGGSSAAVRQLSAGSTIPFCSMSPTPDSGCRAAAQLPRPEQLVHFIFSYALNGGGWGSGR